MSDQDSPPVGARAFEIGVALLLAVLAALVIVDSVRVGTGWSDDGPRSGYFPFYIGLILLGASAWILLGTVLRWRRESGRAFATRAEFAGVGAVLVPMVVYVVLIKAIGIYVASVLLITWFMWRHGRYRWIVTVPVALGVPLAFFLVFERWFLVPLPKGPLEAMLGF